MKRVATIFFVLGLLASIESFSQANHPPLKVFTFQAEEAKMLQGLSTDITKVWGCNKGILEADIIGDLAIASELYQNGCYTDGRYNHQNFRVVKGGLIDNTGNKVTDAYTVYEPSIKATEFLGSQHKVHLKLARGTDFSIYSIEEGVISKIQDVTSDQTREDDFVKLKISASKIVGSRTFFAMKKDEKISVFHSISSEVEGAEVYRDSDVSIFKTRYPAGGSIVDTPSSYQAGPDSHSNRYGDKRHFFTSSRGDLVEILWQDTENGDVTLTSLTPGREMFAKKKMPKKAGLLAGATENNGMWYYLFMETEKSKEGWLLAADSEGRLIESNELDLSRDGLNIFDFDGDESASMAYNNGVLGVIISRTMNRSGDGLNHQGAIAVTFDAESLKVIRNHGQTSGHSFDNYLYSASDGGFVGMDLGDNYPRGINLHKIKDDKRSNVVYSFKTAHGTRSASPAGQSYPKYSEISGSETFYKWSNDNSTYSELGALIEWEDSYDVYFIGEPDPNGRAINNGRAIGLLYDSRDIGYLKVKKDFIQDDYALSQGIDETGGFYSFGGSWSALENKGIKWLVDYQDKESDNASRLKAIRLKNESLIFWEKWTPSSYVTTYMMRVSKDGKPVSSPKDIGTQLRISKSDDIIAIKDRVLFVMGAASDQMLEVVEVHVK